MQRNVELTRQNALNAEQLLMERGLASTSAKASSDSAQALELLAEKHAELQEDFAAVRQDLTHKLRLKDRELYKKALQKRWLQERAVLLPHLAPVMIVCSLDADPLLSSPHTHSHTALLPSLDPAYHPLQGLQVVERSSTQTTGDVTTILTTIFSRAAGTTLHARDHFFARELHPLSHAHLLVPCKEMPNGTVHPTMSREEADRARQAMEALQA